MGMGATNASVANDSASGGGSVNHPGSGEPQGSEGLDPEWEAGAKAALGIKDEGDAEEQAEELVEGDPNAVPHQDDTRQTTVPDDKPEHEAGSPGGDGNEGSDPVNPPVQTVPGANDFIDLGNGARVTRQDAEQFLAFQQFLATNPDVAQLLSAEIDKRVNGAPAQQQQQTPPADSRLSIPEGYEDEPAVKMLVEAYNQQAELVANLQRTQQQVQEQFIARQREETTQLVTKGVKDFQTQHELNDEEITRLYTVAGNLQILPSLVQRDPLTGAPVQTPNIPQAVAKALEVAMWTDPEFRSKQIQSQIEASKEQDTINTQRKKKISTLGGSSGSAPRTPQAQPQNQQDRQQAMIQEVAAAMFGTN